MCEKHCSQEDPCQRYKDLMLGHWDKPTCVFTWRRYRLERRMFSGFVDKLFVSPCISFYSFGLWVAIVGLQVVVRIKSYYMYVFRKELRVLG